MKLRTVDQITDEITNENIAPARLAELGTILSGYYSHYGQMLKRIELVKPEAWLQIQANAGEKPYSDKKTEMHWRTTDSGQKEVALEWELKRIEKMVSSINKRLYVDSVDARQLSH